MEMKIEKQKRERSVNFSQEETDILILLVDANKYVVENKKSDAATWQEKEKAWKDIERAFNSVSSAVFRDHKHLKIKYEAIKRDIRKKMARAENYENAPILSPAEQKIKEIIHSVDDSDSQLEPFKGTSSPVINWMPMPIPAEEYKYQPSTDEATFTDDSSKSTVIETHDESEPPTKKVQRISSPIINWVPSEEHCDQPATNDIIPTNDSRNSTVLENHEESEAPRKNVHRQPRGIRLFAKLTEEKIEIAKIQRQILNEDLGQKLIQRKILEEELQHKYVIHKLEKQHLLLKIQLLQKELEEK